MAASFEQQSRFRKITYAIIIIVLFTAMIPLRAFVASRADQHDLREIDLGQVDLGGSAARFTLASFRGPLICGLWWEAIERHKEHDWTQLRILIDTITKLQPHFRQPWIYQAWNLAYNVSVEFDRVQDKYFFIAEGSQLLGEGERKNRHKVHVTDDKHPQHGEKIERGDPEMRRHLGHYQQQKIAVSDEANYYRCFLQLSCTPPEKWDPAVLRQDPQRLAEFKQEYPRLMHRFRLLKRIPEGAETQFNNELLTFLETHRRLPSFFSAAADKDGRQNVMVMSRFPVWPETMVPSNVADERVQDIYEVSYAWYEFGQDCIMPPRPMPGPSFSPPRGDRMYRSPQMSTLLYRTLPPKAKGQRAKGLADEGMFHLSRPAWGEAHRRWEQLGVANGLHLPEEALAIWDNEAALYRARFPVYAQMAQDPPAAALRDEAIARSYAFHDVLTWYLKNRSLCHFSHWYEMTKTYSEEPATRARAHFYRAANQYRADLVLAKEEYEQGIRIWQQLLGKPRVDFLLGIGPYSDFREYMMCLWTRRAIERTPFGEDRQVQEELAELQKDYLRVHARVQSYWMALGFSSGELTQLIGRQLASPCSQTPLLGNFAGSNLGKSITHIESVLEKQSGPLDWYFEDELRRDFIPPTMPATPPSGPPPGMVSPGVMTPR